MRSVTASLVAWSGRGPVLWAMGCPCRELTMRRRLAAPHRGGPDAGDRTAVPADRAASPDAVLLRSRGVGPGPGRPGTGPRGRGPPGARRWRGHRGGGRHAVSPLRQEGARREVPARRLRQGPGRHRPRQLLCDRRCRGGGAVPGPPGLPAGAVPPAHPQDQRLQDRAGPRDGRPPRQALPGRTIHVVATPRQRGPAWRGLPTRVTSPPAWPPTRSCTDPNPAHRQARTPRLEGRTAGHRRRRGRHHHLDPHPGDPLPADRGRGHGGGHLPVVGSLHRTPIRVVLVRGTSQARPYTLAPATTDLTSTGEQIVASNASRWSSKSRSRTARTSWAPAEINQQVLGNLDQIIAALEADQALPIAQEVADAR